MGISVNIQKRLGDFRLNIAFSSNAKRIGILGPSGCGKSMTLKSIAGIELPDSGFIEIGLPDAFGAKAGAPGGMKAGAEAVAKDGAGAGRRAEANAGAEAVAKDGAPAGMKADVSSALRSGGGAVSAGTRVLYDSARKVNLKPQKRNVGYMFQNYALFPTMSVIQNIAAGLKMPAAERDKRVREMIERFHLQGLEKHLPGELSGGQQQRVALARIMAYRPDLILLDEPFSALDQHLKERLQHEMISLLEDYHGQVIMVSHSRDEIYRFSEELLVMDQGSILARGETQRIFDDPGTVAVARMTGCKNFSAAERLDEHTLHLVDWGVDLYLQRRIPEGIDAIGYRAHFFEPVWGERLENCIPFRLSGMDELPFERRYYIIPDGGAIDRTSECEAASNRPAIDRAAEGEAASNRTAIDRTAAGNAASNRAALAGEGANTEGTALEVPHPTASAIGTVPASELICWFVQDSERRALDHKPAPDFLQMREEAVQLLREDKEHTGGITGGSETTVNRPPADTKGTGSETSTQG